MTAERLRMVHVIEIGDYVFYFFTDNVNNNDIIRFNVAIVGSSQVMPQSFFV